MRKGCNVRTHMKSICLTSLRSQYYILNHHHWMNKSVEIALVEELRARQYKAETMVRLKKILLLVLTAVLFMDVQSQDKALSTTLSKLIQTKHQMTTHMIAMQTNLDKIHDVKKFINTLKDLKHHVQEFMESPLHFKESKRDLVTLRKTIRKNEPKANTNDPLFASFTLAENNNRRMWKLFQIISERIAKSTTIQLHPICQAVRSVSYAESLHDLQQISLANICKDVSSCPLRKTLYSEKRPPKQSDASDQWTVAFKAKPKNWQQMSSKTLRKVMLQKRWILERLHKILKSGEKFRLQIKYKEQDVSTSCTDEKKCDVKKALPMMTGILRYQINEMIFQRFCSRNCADGKCDFHGTYQKALEDLERLMLFAGTLPSYWIATWNSFYKNVVDTGALKSLDTAMSKVDDHKAEFEVAAKQCNLIKFFNACPNGDIFKIFKLLRKIQQSRKSSVKSLRGRLNNYNLKTLLGFKKEELQKLGALGSIKRLNNNLKTTVPWELVRTFISRSEWDIAYANHDIRFIKDELHRYEKKLNTVEIQLQRDVKEIMSFMMTFVSSNSTLEKIANITSFIVTNSNPLKLIFSEGIEVVDHLHQSGTDDAARNMTPMVDALNNLTVDSLKLKRAFGGHPKQIPSLENVIKKIRNNQSSSIGQDALDFLEEYTNYSPMTDRDSLTKNDVLWRNFGNVICNKLNVEGGSSVSNKTKVTAKHLCKRLKETLGNFLIQRDYIFNFQFALVDAIVGVLRGNIGKRFEKSLKGKHSSLQLQADELMTGLFVVQYEIQRIASFYCDQMEYKNLGKPLFTCSSVNGLFSTDEIYSLVNRDFWDIIAYDEKEQDVYIPTRPEAENDTGFIDLQALAKGDTVFFKLPTDLKWLEKHKWVAPGQKAIPFVQYLKLFLPFKMRVNWNTIRVKIISVAESLVSTANSGAVYVLPTNIYITDYTQDGINCLKKNSRVYPYSLCSDHLKICNHVSGTSSPSALLPTVFTTWSVKARIYRGIREVEYDAPNPQTNLLLRAKATLRVPKNVVKGIPLGDAGLALDSTFVSGCCKGNMYRWSPFNRTCEVCPPGTVSFHSGLFCQ